MAFQKKKQHLIFLSASSLAFAVFVSIVFFFHRPDTWAEAADLTDAAVYTLSDGQKASKLKDRNYNTSLTFSQGATITIESETELYGIYIIWNRIPGMWKLSGGERSFTCGQHDFLHEYVDLSSLLSAPARSVTISLPRDEMTISDIYVFAEGELPDWVQVWNPPCEKADILLFSTHSDDEHLFFAGILPYYAGELGRNVQVVYFTHHWNTYDRPHEQLNGLWTVGVTSYPVISPFLDQFSKELEHARGLYEEQEMLAFQVEMLRRFQPLVVIGHDIDGEYGHGVHMLNTFLLQKAVTLSGDKEQFAESAERYGVWDVPKTYLHLWKENPIVMDWDVPLDRFGGKTAYQMSCEGFACHVSQQFSNFVNWLRGPGIEKASDIKQYSCCEFGLYRTTVGLDTGKNDFLEHVTPWPAPTEETAGPEQVTPTPHSVVGSPEASHSAGTEPPASANDFFVICWIAVCGFAVCAIVLLRIFRNGKH